MSLTPESRRRVHSIRMLGPERPLTLKAMHNLAISKLRAGRRIEALQLREEVQPLKRKMHTNLNLDL